jgi:hypothetical protein
MMMCGNSRNQGVLEVLLVDFVEKSLFSRGIEEFFAQKILPFLLPRGY